MLITNVLLCLLVLILCRISSRIGKVEAEVKAQTDYMKEDADYDDYDDGDEWKRLLN
jgi:hypothetical protein